MNDYIFVGTKGILGESVFVIKLIINRIPTIGQLHVPMQAFLTVHLHRGSLLQGNESSVVGVNIH